MILSGSGSNAAQSKLIHQPLLSAWQTLSQDTQRQEKSHPWPGEALRLASRATWACSALLSQASPSSSLLRSVVQEHFVFLSSNFTASQSSLHCLVTKRSPACPQGPGPVPLPSQPSPSLHRGIQGIWSCSQTNLYLSSLILDQPSSVPCTEKILWDLCLGM